MTMFSRMIAHLNEYKYVKGRHMGDAPSDHLRRSRSHERISRRGPISCAVVFIATDVITAYADGSIMLKFAGWESSPTTRAAINNALHRFRERDGSPRYGQVMSRAHGGVTHTVVLTKQGLAVAYDGMMIGPDGTLVTQPEKFKQKRIRKDLSSDLATALKLNGFKDMYPLMYAAHEPGEWMGLCPDDHRYVLYQDPTRLISSPLPDDPAEAEIRMKLWAATVNKHKSEYTYGTDPATGVPGWYYRARTKQETWAILTKECKKRMYQTVRVDLDFLPV